MRSVTRPASSARGGRAAVGLHSFPHTLHYGFPVRPPIPSSTRSPESSLLCHLRSSSSSKPGGRSEPAKQPLKKPKLPVGRFDETEESSIEKEPLEKFPDGINPTTKERGGPRGPEPTRFGDWERKGRCIDF
ncbi:succinate dehydrogenase assembly factor 4, mitochondrial isoform X1 [Corvus hawaiiensis]|uniref:succinate dehydrogenase assembly factor 4, mitochondrial isoform X1 n=1 Tax=Corvus hawaiiensis TaxID=134902 RepID=UPI0020184623|nr:succinate dehydrogenase assembly factor 4, mitochondrial isoform X1 [Corvus hawaiiensis]